jgi:hypothetical protein
LEEKGVHHEVNGSGPPKAVDGKDQPDPANQKGLRTKIKEKLHIGHKAKD